MGITRMKRQINKTELKIHERLAQLNSHGSCCFYARFVDSFFDERKFVYQCFQQFVCCLEQLCQSSK